MVQPADQARPGGYGPTLAAMGHLGKAKARMPSTGPNPQEVADAVVGLVQAAPGTRPVRTLVGAIHPDGMPALNQTTNQMMRSFYGQPGVADLLQRAPSRAP